MRRVSFIVFDLIFQIEFPPRCRMLMTMTSMMFTIIFCLSPNMFFVSLNKYRNSFSENKD